jgi:hypothetical protein
MAMAMAMFGGPLGAHLHSLPNGEVGWRRFWITRVHFQVLALADPPVARCSKSRQAYFWIL